MGRHSRGRPSGGGPRWAGSLPSSGGSRARGRCDRAALLAPRARSRRERFEGRGCGGRQWQVDVSAARSLLPARMRSGWRLLANQQPTAQTTPCASTSTATRRSRPSPCPRNPPSNRDRTRARSSGPLRTLTQAGTMTMTRGFPPPGVLRPRHQAGVPGMASRRCRRRRRRACHWARCYRRQARRRRRRARCRGLRRQACRRSCRRSCRRDIAPGMPPGYRRRTPADLDMYERGRRQS